MQIIKVRGTKFSRYDPALQDVLHEVHRTEERPLCCCTEPPQEMAVARFEGRYILRKMPSSGHLHDFDCASFAPIPGLSGLAEVLGTAIETGDDNITRVRLGFSLEKRPGQVRSASAADGVTTGLKSTPARLTLRGSLDDLWERAELAVWHKGLAGKRSWGVVRHRVMVAANRTSTRSATPVRFGERVFMPPVFDSRREDEIARERDAFFQRLEVSSGGSAPLGILIAEFRSRSERKLHFRNFPKPFFLDQAAADRFDRKFGERIAMVDKVVGAHLIVIATFSYNRGYCNVEEVDMMPVTAEWIPFEHPREAELIAALRERKFVKSLRYNLSASAPMASATLYDTDGPTALYVPPADISADAELALRAAAERAPCRTWFWSASSPRMPPLPPKACG